MRQTESCEADYDTYEVEDDNTEDEYDTEDLDSDEGKGMCPFTDFRSVIARFRNRLVTVQYNCAGCCNKITGILQHWGDDFILLAGSKEKPVLSETFCSGLREPITQSVHQAVIRPENIVCIQMVCE